MQKKILFTIMIILSSLVLAACNQEGDSASSTGSTDDGSYTIGVSLLNLSNEFIVKIQEGIEKAAEEQGVNVEVVDANGDASTQLQQVENFIIEEVDGIILNPVETDASSPAVQAALDAGIPIVNVNAETTTKADAFVGSDDKESAEIAINYIAEQLGEEGNIGMIRGNPGQSAEILRGEGAVKTLENYPNMELVTEQAANWSRDEALDTMQNWLRSFELDAVFAQNDEMAMGALSALENEGVSDEIVLVGVDAIADALNAVSEGRLNATVYQNANAQGAEGMQTLINIIEGEDYEESTYIPFELVTQENVEEYLE